MLLEPGRVPCFGKPRVAKVFFGYIWRGFGVGGLGFSNMALACIKPYFQLLQL